MLNRREFVGKTLGAGAALALRPELLSALQQSQGQLIQRAIPTSGEMLPVISFGPQEEADNAAMKRSLTTRLENGGRVVDALHGGGEPGARTAASELGIQDRLFWTTPLIGPPPRPREESPPPKADPAALRAQIETKLATFKVPSIDVVMASAYNVGNDDAYLAVLRELKEEGKARYIGVHHLAFPPGSSDPFWPLDSIVREEQIDFVATDYSIGDRRVEETILPIAQERNIGFLAYFTFDRGRIFRRAGSTPLPEWAAEFDAKTWPQFCLKYVLGHPGVIVARTGTTNAEHMLDNIGGGIGRLPDDATRKRMAEFVDTLPPTPPR